MSRKNKSHYCMYVLSIVINSENPFSYLLRVNPCKHFCHGRDAWRARARLAIFAKLTYPIAAKWLNLVYHSMWSCYNASKGPQR